MIRKLLLAVAALAVTAPAHADWYEASTRHFVVYSDQSAASVTEYATELERFDKAARTLGGWPDEPTARPNRVTVYVVPSLSMVRALARNDKVAGFYSARMAGSLAIVPRRSGNGGKTDLDAQQVLLHEYTHHLMATVSPHAVYPAWFVEGFAELYATTVFERDGSVLIGNPPLYRAYGLLRGNLLPVERMFAADTSKLNDEQRDALYGRGWLLAHYTLIARKRPGQLAAYLNALNEGKPAMEAAGVFGDFRALDRELERYKLSKLSAYRVDAKAIGTPEVAVRKLTPGEEATMKVRIRSKVGVNATTAPEVYADAQKAAAPFPDDAGAQIVLAETAFDAKDYAAAEAAADRAIAADPKAVDGYLYKAKARMALARKAGDRSKETLAAIRKVIADGNRLEPDDPELLVLYYRSFADPGFAPTKNAKDALVRAFELAPQDSRLRMNTAMLYLREGDKAMARSLLAPLAWQPHQRGLSAVAARMIERIDAEDAKGAVAAGGGEDSDEPEPDDPA